MALDNIIIRPMKKSDAEAIHQIRLMPNVMKNILSVPSERIEKQEHFFTQINPNHHVFVAEVKQGDQFKVIGLAGIFINANIRLRHSAGLAIFVDGAYHGQGVGHKLMDALIDMADNWLMLVRIDLEVFTDNKQAIKLYKSYGFEIEGEKKMATIRNGEYINEYIMARIRKSSM